ncbi:MAG: NUDIX domain-containing protein [Candidatus Lokiarchaeota archaeon]|nr:NUDIX domain-containing protein [Candidatus Lokiarchaeota archaeon]
MEENLRFVYEKEYWYISAFINTNEFIGETKAEEIEALLLDRLKNLTENDLKKAYKFLEKYPNAEEKKRSLVNMAKSINIECDWEPFFQNFPYTDENNPYTEDSKDLTYNTLGYFKLEVEYYRHEPFQKERITPDILQQIPFISIDILKEFSKKRDNQYLLLDIESPIYVFVISNKLKPMEIQWTEENINKYKKTIGMWTQVYSGQWIDYSDKLYRRRTKKNLSNRVSELHYIQRNSGFVYMTQKNYETEFDYINQVVLSPTPEVRAVLFALMSINNSLDILFMKRYSDVFMSLEQIEEKTKNLRFLRGMIQTKMSLIYSELDWNPREHFIRILIHLLKIFRIEVIIERVNDKFKTLYDTLQELYTKRHEENQKNTKKAVNFLSILFGAGFILEFANALRITFGLGEEDQPTPLIHALLTSILGIGFVVLLGYFIYGKVKAKHLDYGHTVDAVIQDDDRNVILIKRRYAPYKNKYALPGGFIKYNEDPKQAIIREVREETNLAVKIISKIGTYDQKGRDPRGRIISIAFKCRPVKDLSMLQEGDDASRVEIIPIDRLKNLEFAFDHNQILRDAGVLK